MRLRQGIGVVVFWAGSSTASSCSKRGSSSGRCDGARKIVRSRRLRGWCHDKTPNGRARDVSDQLLEVLKALSVGHVPLLSRQLEVLQRSCYIAIAAGLLLKSLQLGLGRIGSAARR